jgi:hypothetical protein
MAIFGGARDASFIRRINKELLGDIINQQCIFYKHNIEATKTNIYGEPEKGIRFFKDPVIFNCLINRNDPRTVNGDLGTLDIARNLDFYFLRDHLVEASLFPEIGDIIMYHEVYYEVDEVIDNQLFVGKNPMYTNSPNPLNNALDKFGYSVSIICKTNYVSADKVNITKTRI